MKKMIILLLAGLVATSAFAVGDPDDDMLGIYFDTNADQNCMIAPTSVPFNTYIILTNTTAPSIDAYELGLDVVVPAGMEGSIFRMTSLIANGTVSGIDVGTNDALGGDFIVGLATALPAQPAMILHSFQYMLLASMTVDFYMAASSAPSIPGNVPVVQNAEGSILMQVGLSTGGPGIPVANINGDCVVGVEERSFGSVKSLFR